MKTTFTIVYGLFALFGQMHADTHMALHPTYIPWWITNPIERAKATFDMIVPSDEQENWVLTNTSRTQQFYGYVEGASLEWVPRAEEHQRWSEAIYVDFIYSSTPLSTVENHFDCQDRVENGVEFRYTRVNDKQIIVDVTEFTGQLSVQVHTIAPDGLLTLVYTIRPHLFQETLATWESQRAFWLGRFLSLPTLQFTDEGVTE